MASQSTCTQLKKPALEVVLTVLHAGGKFGDGGYSVSGGLHGVGISVVNALSQDLEVVVKRDGFLWNQNYKLGVPQAPLKKGETTDKTGTQVTFWPSEEIFETTDFSFETLSARFREMSFLNKGLTLSLKDERPSHVDENGEPLFIKFNYPGGISDFVKHLNLTKGEGHKSIISFGGEDVKQKCRLKYQCNGILDLLSQSTHSQTRSTLKKAEPTKKDFELH